MQKLVAVMCGGILVLCGLMVAGVTHDGFFGSISRLLKPLCFLVSRVLLSADTTHELLDFRRDQVLSAAPSTPLLLFWRRYHVSKRYHSLELLWRGRGLMALE
jgi:hypothetical protein